MTEVLVPWSFMGTSFAKMPHRDPVSEEPSPRRSRREVFLTSGMTRARSVSMTLWLVVSSLLFGTMAFWAKLACHRLSGAEVAFYRFAIGLVLIAATFLATGTRPRLTQLRLLLMRAAFGGISVLLYFSTLPHIGVGLAVLLNCTSPVFSALFAARFLEEHVSLSLAMALLLTLVGAVFTSAGYAQATHMQLGLWALMGLCGALFSGAAIASIRGLRLAKVGSLEIMTFFFGSGLLFTAPYAFASYVRPDTKEWILIAGVGLAAYFAQLTMSYALAGVGAAVSGTIGQLTPVTAMVLGFIFLGEPVTAFSLVGTGLAATGVIWATQLSAKAALKARGPVPRGRENRDA